MNVGDDIPEVAVTPDRYLPHRYAGASGDFNPIHIDAEFARSVGLPGNILHGLYGMALVARAVAALGNGDPRSLKRLSVDFRGMAVPEVEIVVSGSVTESSGSIGTVKAVAKQGGKRIIRNAVADVETQ